MANYNWSEEEILNSTELTEVERKMLLAELRKEKDGLTLFTSESKDESKEAFKEFKKRHRKCERVLKRFSMPTYKFTNGLYTLCDIETPTYIPQEETELTTSTLLEDMYSFIASLEDKEILEIYESIISSPKHLLNIDKKDPNNKATEQFNGRCVTSSGSKDTYISIYTHGDLRDLTLLAHEFGHAFDHRMFDSYEHPVTKYYAIETSSYLFELLMGNFINDGLDRPTASAMLLSNRFNETVDAAWAIKIQKELYKQLKFNVQKINDLMIKNNRNRIYEQSDFKYLTHLDTTYFSLLINSYLTALEIFYTCIEDKEKGLALYKKIFTDEEQSIDVLLSKYNIDYKEDLSNFNSMYTLSETVNKMLTK